MKNYSFVMLKPDAIKRDLVPIIVFELLRVDLSIELLDYQIASAYKIIKHYAEKIAIEGDSFVVKATKTFSGKPVIPILLSSNNKDIIIKVREIIGVTDPSKAPKTTIRGKYEIDSMEKSESEMRCCDNLIHASDSYKAFLNEVFIWFDCEALKSLQFFNDYLRL